VHSEMMKILQVDDWDLNTVVRVETEVGECEVVNIVGKAREVAIDSLSSQSRNSVKAPNCCLKVGNLEVKYSSPPQNMTRQSCPSPYCFSLPACSPRSIPFQRRCILLLLRG